MPPRIIRELLGEVVGPDRLPKGDRRLFNWAPDRKKVAAAKRAGIAGERPPPAVRPRDPDRIKPFYKDGKPVRGEHGPSTLTSGGRPRAKTEADKAKPEYKAGWARPKKTPKPKPKVGPKRAPKGRS